MMKVPFVDLNTQYQSIKSEIDEAIASCFEKVEFIGGSAITQFENDFAQYIGVGHCISCANGTDALELSFKALGIGIGDEVIVPAVSWISTSGAVSAVGAIPVFVDVNPDNPLLDVSRIEEALTERTKAIVAVHLYGIPVEMDRVAEIAQRHKLFVIEDCAQAHGAEYRGVKVGAIGDIATFSFYPSKNLGAYGDGGAILTKHTDLADKVRLLTQNGQLNKNEHIIEGHNSRLDAIQAAILGVKLKYLDQWNQLRIQAAQEYSWRLERINLRLSQLPNESKCVYHVFNIQVENRKFVKEKLLLTGIETAIHYPKALPYLNPYKKFGHTMDDFPNAVKHCSTELSLPMYPLIKAEQIEEVCNSLKRILN